VVCELPHGEDLLGAIENAAIKTGVRSGVFSLIGALENARFGFYGEEGGYEPIEIQRHLEITSCMGNMADEDGRLAIHAHMTVADSEGRVYGGHLLAGSKIYMRAELMIFEIEGAQLRRKVDKATGLHVLQT